MVDINLYIDTNDRLKNNSTTEFNNLHCIIQNTNELELDLYCNTTYTFSLKDNEVETVNNEIYSKYYFAIFDNYTYYLDSTTKTGITYKYGISKLMNFTISEPSELVADLISIENTSCDGNKEGIATLDVYGGTGSYYYNWNNSKVPGIESPDLPAGTYVLEISDGKHFSIYILYISPLLFLESREMYLNIPSSVLFCTVVHSLLSISLINPIELNKYSVKSVSFSMFLILRSNSAIFSAILLISDKLFFLRQFSLIFLNKINSERYLSKLFLSSSIFLIVSKCLSIIEVLESVCTVFFDILNDDI